MNEQPLNDRIKQLESQLKTFAIASILALSTLGIFAILSSFALWVRIPYYIELYRNVFQGEPLPASTNFVIEHRNALLIFDLIMSSTPLIYVLKKRVKTLLPVGVAIFILLSIKALICFSFLEWPMTQGLGGLR